MNLAGVRTTTPLRTALDLACNVKRADALSALDAFARQHHVSREALLSGLERFKGRRGVIQARELVLLMDPRAESERETRLRLALADAGLPAPRPQWVVIIDGHEFRLDLAYPAHRVGVEYDGEEWHGTEEQRRHDNLRRRLLEKAGWVVIVVRRGDFSPARMDSWLSDVRDALEGRYTSLRW